MAYNISIAENISGVSSAFGFVNVNAGGLFFVLLLLTATLLVAMYAMRNGMKEFRAIFVALVLTLIPMVLFSSFTEFGVPFIPAWYIVLHLTLLAISGTFAYFNK